MVPKQQRLMTVVMQRDGVDVTLDKRQQSVDVQRSVDGVALLKGLKYPLNWKEYRRLMSAFSPRITLLRKPSHCLKWYGTFQGSIPPYDDKIEVIQHANRLAFSKGCVVRP